MDGPQWGKAVVFQSVSNITRGIAWLDQHAPGWVDRIDLDVLDVADPERCPLGQIFGSYTDGLDVIGQRFGSPGGFCSGGGLMTDGSQDDYSPDEYPALNAAWRAAIIDRRMAEQLTVQ